MSIMPNVWNVRKVALWAAAVGVCFLIGAAKNVFAVQSCEASYSICKASCKQRQGVYKYACYGDNVEVETAHSTCLCVDQYDDYQTHQMVLTELRRLQSTQRKESTKP